MQIRGACHCGNIAFDLVWPEGVPIPVRACRCTFCRKHGAAWTAHPEATLTVNIVDGSRTSRYRFGTGTADFHVCATCGAVPVCTSSIDGTLHAVVNVRSLDEVPMSAETPVDFDGEATAARLERRAKHWIRRVTWTVAEAAMPT